MDFGVFVMRNCKNYLRGVCMSGSKGINLTARYEVLTDVLLKSKAVCNLKQRCRASISDVSKDGFAFFRDKQAINTEWVYKRLKVTGVY
jgi:ribosomal protein L2